MTTREIQGVFYDVLDKGVADEILSSKKALRDWIQRMVWHVRRTNELEDELKKSYDFNAKVYVKGWNDGRNCAFDIILNLLERIEDKNGRCENDKIKLVIEGFRMMEKENTDI